MSLSARDEALFLQIADEEIVTRLFRYHTKIEIGDVALPPRAGGFARLLRKMPGGEEAWKRALLGDMVMLDLQVTPTALKNASPALLHQSAIYWDRVANALDPHEESRVIEACVRSLAAWLALGKDAEYLRAFANDVMAGHASDEELTLATTFANHVLRDLANEARAGAAARTLPARLRILALKSLGRAAALAGLSSKEASPYMLRAERAVTDAAEASLAPISAKLEAAEVANTPADARGAILAEVAKAWFFSGFDVAVEEFAVDRATPIAWEIYRSSDNRRNRAMLEPLMPLFESLARKIESDPLYLPYSARCAEISLFYYELEPTLELQIKGCERVLAFCPTHNNARMVLAQYLCTKALRVIVGPVVTQADLQLATSIVERAEKIYPQTTQIEKTKTKIAEASQRLLFRWPQAR